LAALTGTNAGAGPFATGDVAWLHRIWHMPLWALDDDDLMLMVGRGKGMPFVAALACDRLSEQPLRGGRSGVGALLVAVAAMPDDVFTADPSLAPALASRVRDAQAALTGYGLPLSAARRVDLTEELTLAAARAAEIMRAT
jgi:hypothetical protein